MEIDVLEKWLENCSIEIITDIHKKLRELPYNLVKHIRGYDEVYSVVEQHCKNRMDNTNPSTDAPPKVESAKSQILRFFIEHPLHKFTTGQIAHYLNLETASVYPILITLAKDRIINQSLSDEVSLWQLQNLDLCKEYINRETSEPEGELKNCLSCGGKLTYYRAEVDYVDAFCPKCDNKPTNKDSLEGS